MGDNKWGMETLEEWVAIDKERKRLKAEAEERENAAATARNQKREIMMKVGEEQGEEPRKVSRKGDLSPRRNSGCTTPKSRRRQSYRSSKRPVEFILGPHY